MADHSAPSIRILFDDAVKLYEDIEQRSSNDDSFQELVQKAMHTFLATARNVQSAAIFSKNEQLDDISTLDLSFLLIDYYLGQLQQKLVTERLKHLTDAKALFDSFLMTCERLKLVHKEDLQSWRRERNADAQTKRTEKIERARREKQAKSKLGELMKKDTAQQNKVASGYILKQTADENQNDNDESRRELTLLRIDIAIRAAVEEFDAIKQEMELLQGMEQMKAKNGGKLPPTPPPPATAQPRPPLVLTREMIQQQVFAHTNLPTMTPEQWADELISRGVLPSAADVNASLQQQGQQQNQEASNEKANEDADEATDKEHDEKQLKERAFDDWKDEHPRGQGNMNDNYFKRG